MPANGPDAANGECLAMGDPVNPVTLVEIGVDSVSPIHGPELVTGDVSNFSAVKLIGYGCRLCCWLSDTVTCLLL